MQELDLIWELELDIKAVLDLQSHTNNIPDQSCEGRVGGLNYHFNKKTMSLRHQIRREGRVRTYLCECVVGLLIVDFESSSSFKAL